MATFSLSKHLEHVSSNWCFTDSILVGAVTSFISYLVYLQFTANAIPSYSRYTPFLTQWNFFAKRSELLADAFKRFNGAMFRMKIIGYPVIVARSHQARAFFFGDRHLSFTEGYKILLGGAPRLEDIKVEAENLAGDNLPWFQNRITHLLRKERLNELLPKLIADMDGTMDRWGKEGTLEPFKDIYDASIKFRVIFQLTVRAALCNEVADNPAQTARIKVLYERIERSADAKSHVFPWLPNSVTKSKNDALKELYTLLSDIIDAKKAKGSSELDTIQAMIELGDGTADIVQFALGTLFAGVLNTTNIACWIPLFLDANPEWKAKVAVEIKALLGDDGNETEPVAARLLQLPPSAWEEDLPVIDTVIRETIRLVVTGVAMRRNVDKDVVIDGKVVEKGAFLIYPLNEIHFDPEIYSDPYNFDPGRFDRGREEDRKAHFGYLGWGVGRHPCLGMRFAKLELKMLTVYLLACFDFTHVDREGRRKRADGHSVDRNLVFQVFPKDKETFLKYRRIAA